MLKYLAIASLSLGFIPQISQAQIPQIGVSSGSTVVDFSGFSETSGQSWGNYEALNVAVQSGASVALPDVNLVFGSLGSVGGFEIIQQTGGYTGQSYSFQEFTGQSVTSQTNF